MLLDARKPEEVPDEIQAKTVIIGGGTLGLFLAVSLARARIPVLLVEAGDRVADTARNAQTATSIGKDHQGVTLGRAFGLGGTSVLWGGQLVEFEPSDLQANGNSWPLDHAELRRWYEHVYAFFDVRRETPEHYRHLFGAEAAEPGDSIERFFTAWLPQPNFAALFRKEIVANPLITLVLNATMNGILFAGSTAQAVGAVAPGGRKIRISADRFVFATGTIETSRFFLSTQRSADVPWKSSPHVGAYFQDHLAGKIAGVQILDERKLRAYFENAFAGGLKLQPKLRFTPATREKNLSGVAGDFTFESKLGENIQNIKALIRALKSGRSFSGLATLPADIRALGTAFLPLILRYVRDRRVLAFFDRGLEFHMQAEQLPTANSKIKLLDDAPAADGLFRAAVDWQIDGREIETIGNFARAADAYLTQRGIARLQIDEALLRGDPSFLARLGDTYHQCGGMRMAASASAGVVDPDCRVWGTNNLFVAGACVFPTSSHANCTLTALALTARLAQRLLSGNPAS